LGGNPKNKSKPKSFALTARELFAVVVAVGLLTGGVTYVLTGSSDEPKRVTPKQRTASSPAASQPRDSRSSDTTVALASIFSTVAGAVLVALLGIGASRQRQERDLSEERQRLEKQLENDRALRAQEEQHDREKDLRAVLEDAASKLQTARRTLERLSSLWRDGLPFSDPMVREANTEREQTIEQFRFAADRIDIRLGPSSEIAIAFEKAADRLNRYFRALGGHKNGSPYDAKILMQARRDLMKAQTEFLNAARSRAGLEEPQLDA
jgi:hypothetical protein